MPGPSSCPISSDFDFLDPDVNLKALPIDELAELRKSEPIHWVDVPGGTGGFGDKGYWLVTKHADVKGGVQAQRHLRQFARRRHPGVAAGDDPRRDRPAEERVAEHGRAAAHPAAQDHLAWFHPRAIGRLRDELNERAQNIAREAVAAGTGDFVERVSCELPLQAIAELLGVPQDDRDKLFRWSNEMTGGEDPEYADIDPAMSSFELITYAMKMAEERSKNPTEDIVTKLIEADIEGEKLSDDEFGFFVIMLAVAGNETTRNSITHGMVALANNPQQWELYKKDRPETAADEIIRWATPVSAFQRTALEDTVLSGVQIKKGSGW